MNHAHSTRNDERYKKVEREDQKNNQNLFTEDQDRNRYLARDIWQLPALWYKYEGIAPVLRWLYWRPQNTVLLTSLLIWVVDTNFKGNVLEA